MRVEVTCDRCVANVLILDVPVENPGSVKPDRAALSAAVFGAGWDGTAILQPFAPLVGTCTECRG